MAYTDIYDAATDENHVLRKQVWGSLHKAATDIVNEDPETENHGRRARWAKKVLGSLAVSLSEAENAMGAVLQNATIQSNPTTSTDSDVQFAVNSIVNTLANR